MKNIEQAFIFAAGRGERMRPLTDTIPKPLLKVKDQSIIDYSIHKLLKKDEFKKIFVNGFYLANQIEDHLENINSDKIVFSHELEKIETGGGLLFARDKIDFNKPLLTINGDIFWQDILPDPTFNGKFKVGSGITDDIDLICDEFSKKNCDILLGLKKKEEYFGYDSKIGDFEMDDDGNLTKYEDQEMKYAFVGLSVINPKILLEEFVSDFGNCFSMSKIYKKLLHENKEIKRIKGIELTGKYFHIGDVESLKKINE